jgi:hypothetical protein
MITTGSRYMGQPVITVPTPTGHNTAVFGPPPSGIPDYVYYTVVVGDRLDLIAQRMWGVPDYWWKIADVNPEVWYPDDLVIGSNIRIPSL